MLLSLQYVGILAAVTCTWEEQGKKDGFGSELSVSGHVVLLFLGMKRQIIMVGRVTESNVAHLKVAKR